MRRMYGFHYLSCPLCQAKVKESQPESCKVLPLNPTFAEPLSCTNDSRLEGDYSLTFTSKDTNFRTCSITKTYPSVEYKERSLLIHKKCFELVKGLSIRQLYLLTDVIEPTFLDRWSLSDTREHTAFHSHGLYFPLPASAMRDLLNRLPPEIQSMVLKYDVGRLLFVVKTASQIATRHEGIESVPDKRFSQTVLILKSDVIRIYSINIGGRIYISRVSDPTDVDHNSMKWKDCKLDGSGYLAVKCDGFGVVDIAFEATNAGPRWILNNRAGWQVQPEVSIIRCANVRQLRIIHDALKCRAIIPLNRVGAEPYFRTQPFPPRDSWVDSGFRVESKITVHNDPFAYFTRANYIPFKTLKNLYFEVDFSRRGIRKFKANDPEPPKWMPRWKIKIYFPEPPTKIKFFICGVLIANIQWNKYPFLQFVVDGEWQPPLPEYSVVMREYILEDVLGIWWGENYPRNIPPEIGIVVPNEAGLKNTVPYTEQEQSY